MYLLLFPDCGYNEITDLTLPWLAFITMKDYTYANPKSKQTFPPLSYIFCGIWFQHRGK